MASCSDFLDKEPLDQGTEAIMFNNPSQFEQAAYALYNLPGWNNADYDSNTDISGIGSNGGGSAPQNTDNWSTPYSQLRTINILLQKAADYGDQASIATSVGTAYFFRAWQHYTLLQRFGGVPIIDHVLDVNDPVLFGPRNSRYEVVDLIIKDLQQAVNLLPKRADIGFGENRGKLTREAAQAFLARVALYEATWEKYVPSINYDLDGDGKIVGAGTAKPEGYPSINDMLTIDRKSVV